METLIIHPNSTAQWHALVQDAGKFTHIHLTESLESYLVFLLMRFEHDPEMVQSILAIDFLESLEKLGHERLQRLKEVGDRCLLFAGLFPGRARKRRVKISYFVKLGQSAYSSLSTYKQNDSSILFGELCDHFVGLMDILQAMRELDEKQLSIDPLEAAELWADTQSLHALRILKSITHDFTMISSSSPNLKH